MEKKPRLLDLFCGAGGCTKGYQRAGFWVRGVDIKPQPRYCGEEFIHANALEYLAELIESGEIDEFDAIHASPPCQDGSITKYIHPELIGTYPQLIPQTRELLKRGGRPWVIENTKGSPLEYAITLCGTSFGLRVIRHRLFESNILLFGLSCGRHGFTGVSSGYSKDTPFICVAGHNFNTAQGRVAMGIEWMTRDELAEAIPPAYTEFIGRQLMAAVKEAP
jgi:DNA (cytosine-5)-methyltransferase 1